MEFNGFTLLVLIVGFFAGRGFQKLMAYGERNTLARQEKEWLDNAEESQRDAWLEKYSWRK